MVFCIIQKYLQISKSAADLSEKDLINYDVVIMLAGISNDPYGNLDYKKSMIRHGFIQSKLQNLQKTRYSLYFSTCCSVYGV